MVDTQQKFTDAKRGNYNALDLNEVLFPMLQRAEKTLHGYHTNYRIQEHEKFGEQAVGLSVGDTIGRVYVDHHDPKSLRTIGAEINTMLRDNLSGVVPNGMRGSKANEVVIDSVINSAITAGDPFMAKAILSNVTTNGGKNNLAELPYAKQKLEAARHSIIQTKHQMDVINEWDENVDFRARVKDHQEDTMKWADDAHNRLTTVQGREEVVRGDLQYGMYLLSHPDPKGDWKKKLEDVSQSLEKTDPEKGAWFRNFQHNAMKQKVEVVESVENKRAIAHMALDMARNPMTFDETRLAKAVEGGVISTGTFLSQMSELVKERRAGENPLMASHTFNQMIAHMEKGVQASRDAEFDPRVRSDITDAIVDLRAEARAWIEKNPKAGPAEFEVEMRKRAREITGQYAVTDTEAGRAEATKQFKKAEMDEQVAKADAPKTPEKPKTGFGSDPDALDQTPKKREPLTYKTLRANIPDDAQHEIMRTFERMTTPKDGERKATERDLQKAIIAAYAPLYHKDKRDMEEMMKMVDETMHRLVKSKKKE
jgi:hypothetical protein